MTYGDFERKWLTEGRVDYDHVEGFQCTDLIKQYAFEVFGLRAGTWGNAIQYWTDTNAGLLTKFHKVASDTPQQGDIVVLKTVGHVDYTGNGHVGIATGNNSNGVQILEQNGSTGNGEGKGKDRVRTRFVPQSRVAGLLRPNTVAVVTPVQPSPQGAAVLNTGNEQYEIIVPVPGYITSTQAANHDKPVVTVQPQMYYVFSKRVTPNGIMIHVTKAPGQYGAWINPADNVTPPEPEPVKPVVVEQAPVPITSNVTIVPSAGSVVGNAPAPTVTTLNPTEEVKTAYTEPVLTSPPDWRSTFEPVIDPRGYVNYVYAGESTKIYDIEQSVNGVMSEEHATKKEIPEGFILPISGQFLKDERWYARIHKSGKPAKYEYSWHGVPAVDENGTENLYLAKGEVAENVQQAIKGTNIALAWISKVLTVLANSFDALNDKIKKGNA
jgi:surface antigen